MPVFINAIPVVVCIHCPHALPGCGNKYFLLSFDFIITVHTDIDFGGLCG